MRLPAASAVAWKESMTSEVRLVAGTADVALREHFDDKLSALNAAVTGHHDGQLLSVAVPGDGGDLCPGLYGWTWGGCGCIDLLCETTSAAIAWEPGSSPQPKPRSGTAETGKEVAAMCLCCDDPYCCGECG
jgi:hypothetical protein